MVSKSHLARLARLERATPPGPTAAAPDDHWGPDEAEREWLLAEDGAARWLEGLESLSADEQRAALRDRFPAGVAPSDRRKPLLDAAIILAECGAYTPER